jgi:glycerophosphoryl diester phosphodiesterase
VSSLILVLIIEKKIVLRWKVRIFKRKFTFGKFNFIRKNNGKICLLALLAAVIVLAVIIGSNLVRQQNDKWSEHTTVAHAGGRIDGHYYSNCVDAILVNYENGQRTFEIDFAVTSDNKLVGKHDWDYVVQEGNSAGEVWSEEQFLSVPIFGQYEPLSFARLCELMDEYPDIWIVTDTKDTDKENVQNEFKIMVETAKELGLRSVLDRFVVQIYDEEMYSYVREVYPFKSWMYTLYMFFGGDEETFTECVRFCYANNIGNIATWNYFVTPELIEIADEYGIAYYAHTEDDVENAKLMIEEGLSGIYTNIITPDMLEED